MGQEEESRQHFFSKAASHLRVRSSRRFQGQGSQLEAVSIVSRVHTVCLSRSPSKLCLNISRAKELARHGRLQSISRELCHGNESREKLMMAHKITVFKRSKSERPHGAGFEYKRAGHNFQLHQVGIHLTHLPACASTHTLGMQILLSWTF